MATSSPQPDTAAPISAVVQEGPLPTATTERRTSPAPSPETVELSEEGDGEGGEHRMEGFEDICADECQYTDVLCHY